MTVRIKGEKAKLKEKVQAMLKEKQLRNLKTHFNKSKGSAGATSAKK